MVCGYHDRVSSLRVVLQECGEPPDSLRVEPVRRLVEKQKVGFPNEGRGQRDASLHAQGIVFDFLVCRVFHLCELQHFGDLLCAEIVRERHAVDVLPTCEPGQQPTLIQ